MFFNDFRRDPHTDTNCVNDLVKDGAEVADSEYTLVESKGSDKAVIM